MKSYQYIYMQRLGTTPSGKTQIFQVVNKRSNEPIGQVRWYGPWRQYTFQPEYETVFSAGCLADIQDFIGAIKAGQL
jgi:hypothetical protein